MNTGSKALAFASKIVPPIAGIASFMGDPLADGRANNLKDVFDFMKGHILGWQFPDLGKWWNAGMNLPQYSGPIIGGLLAGLGIPMLQSFVKHSGFTLPEAINSSLELLKRTAAASFAGGMAGMILWLPGSIKTQGVTGLPEVVGQIWQN